MESQLKFFEKQRQLVEIEVYNYLNFGTEERELIYGKQYLQKLQQLLELFNQSIHLLTSINRSRYLKQ
jgi:hypothetical protein